MPSEDKGSHELRNDRNSQKQRRKRHKKHQYKHNTSDQDNPHKIIVSGDYDDQQIQDQQETTHFTSHIHDKQKQQDYNDYFNEYQDQQHGNAEEDDIENILQTVEHFSYQNADQMYKEMNQCVDANRNTQKKHYSGDNTKDLYRCKQEIFQENHKDQYNRHSNKFIGQNHVKEFTIYLKITEDIQYKVISLLRIVETIKLDKNVLILKISSLDQIQKLGLEFSGYEFFIPQQHGIIFTNLKKQVLDQVITYQNYNLLTLKDKICIFTYSPQQIQEVIHSYEMQQFLQQ
ncbi:hypothetical protein SS50377_20184 [Spironucleus salmonicida]|uniref:Uncharacterized protein n=1 Tax=Spironucleus salmonicida TaxID=348837 RepID=V6LWR4_9EUKA|nr:hypothetical protein SS50377_20184 [Spironucleus salmonicida]|eukprot:EST45239.1 Hypothetical protein SS50377_14815 [Spironucleus salmonicida]